jgi:hypothetical protein
MDSAAEVEQTTSNPEVAEPAHAVVRLPESSRGDEPRGSFWRRIAQRARGSLARPVVGDRVLARLDAVERSLCERIDQLDTRLAQVWEVEEQLSQLRDLQATLAEVRDRQSLLETRTRGIATRLTLLLLTGIAGVAAVLALLALG